MDDLRIKFDLVVILNTLMRTALDGNNVDKTLWSVWHMSMKAKNPLEESSILEINLRPQFLLRHRQGVGAANIFVQPDSEQNVLDDDTCFTISRDCWNIYNSLHECGRQKMLKKYKELSESCNLSLYSSLHWQLKSEIIDCRVPMFAEGICDAQFVIEPLRQGKMLREIET